MLRNRSSRSAMTSTKQQAYSSESASPVSQNHNKRQVPSFFVSPRFKAFTKALTETEASTSSTYAIISPTSILDAKQFLFFDHDIKLNPPKSPNLFSENKHKGIGLALIDSSPSSNAKSIEEISSSILFGTNLRGQIPSFSIQSPKSPSGWVNSSTTQTEANCREGLSLTEMELSEEYTCIISHGPNPKTTHIFDNCIIENYCSLSDTDTMTKNNPVPENFLSFCYTCKKNLEQRFDIYIYRGEKAFCSQECRYHEMLLDEEEEEEEKEVENY